MKQDVHVASSTPKYPSGMRFAKRGKVWHYTKLATTTRTGGIYGATGYGGITQGLGLFSVAKSSGALTIVRAVKGERTITISAPTLVAGAYAGGLVTIYESTALPVLSMGVISNTATVILLDGPLPATYTPGAITHSQVVTGPYYEVVMPGPDVSAGAAFDYCPGIFNTPFDEDGNDPEAGDYVWLQTWGLCYMWVCAAYRGGVGGEREVIMRGDGAGQTLAAGDIATMANHQRVGVLYPGTGAAAVGNNPGPTNGTAVTVASNVVLLQIAP
ncbi:hypothetical protein ES703_109444 [subsurface metagenome]